MTRKLQEHKHGYFTMQKTFESYRFFRGSGKKKKKERKKKKGKTYPLFII